MDFRFPALAPRGVPAQGFLWTCYRGWGTAGFGVRRATLRRSDITIPSFSAWGDRRDTYLSGWLKIASTVILSMPFVTQIRLESKHGVVQRTGLSCFLCPRPPLIVEAAVLKCLEGWPDQLYKHLLSSQHMPCPGLERSDERWAFLLEAHCPVMEGTGKLMGHAAVAASRCTMLSSLR